MRKQNLGMLVLAVGLLPAFGCAQHQYPYYGYYGYQPAPYYAGYPYYLRGYYPYPVGAILARRQELRLTRVQQERLGRIHEHYRRENAADLERARREMHNFRVRHGRGPDPREVDGMLTQQKYPRLFQNMHAAHSEALQVLTPGQRQMLLRPGVRVPPR